MMTTLLVDQVAKAPVQEHFESLIKDCVSIDVIISDPLFRIVMNPTIKSKPNAAGQIKGFVRDGTNQAPPSQADPALTYALHIRDAITRLLLQHKLRYSGNNSHGGHNGRVQIFLKGKWQVVKGLTHRNFPLPAVKRQPSGCGLNTTSSADTEIK